MRIKYFGFILLIWFPGGLHAQNDTKPCRAPTLDEGYFVPELETYPHGTNLQYACLTRHKPAVDGWWATSTCHQGIWSHKPQCIDENACVPPNVVNGKYTDNRVGWYSNGDIIRITCDRGYEHKDFAATAQCNNGTWSSLPICQKDSDSCSEPPKIPHAVVINQQYQELFPTDSRVRYECKEGYTLEGTHRNPIICIAGAWTEGPSCRIRQGAGQGGSAEVGRGGGGGDTTSSGGGTQPGGRDSRPGTGQGGSAEVGRGGGGGGGGGDTTSSGGGTQPGGRGGSSTDTDRKPQITATINNCGPHPIIPNGDVVQEDQMFLKYKCNAFYTLVGEATVVCHNDGRWSQLPSCKEAFCVMKPGHYDHGFKLDAAQFIKEGERKYFPCVWHDFGISVHCNNGKLSHSQCCRSYDHYRGVCPMFTDPI